MPQVYTNMKKCPVCGNWFIPTFDWIYKTENRWYDRYNCFRKDEKAVEEERKLRQEGTRLKRQVQRVLPAKIDRLEADIAWRVERVKQYGETYRALEMEEVTKERKEQLKVYKNQLKEGKKRLKELAKMGYVPADKKDKKK